MIAIWVNVSGNKAAVYLVGETGLQVGAWILNIATAH